MATYQLRVKVILCCKQVLVEVAGQPFKILLVSDRVTSLIHKRFDPVSPMPCARLGLKKICIPITIFQQRYP
jgi:hypothetical protein